MKKFAVNKNTREMSIDGNLAGVGWTEQMDTDVKEFGKKIAYAVTKCMFIKMVEKHQLTFGDRIALKTKLSLIFDV